MLKCSSIFAAKVDFGYLTTGVKVSVVIRRGQYRRETTLPVIVFTDFCIRFMMS
jgi:hypothetical protein